MDEITLKNYRCFREEQVARMAPLTLLVGENSTGKTSFLAMVRILWDIAGGRRMPDFKESPYDLGSFDEVAHHRGGRGGRARIFEAGFKIENPQKHLDKPYKQSITFEKGGTVPVPVRKFFAYGGITLQIDTNQQSRRARFTNGRGHWERAIPHRDYQSNQQLPYDDIMSAIVWINNDEAGQPHWDEIITEFIYPVSRYFNRAAFLQPSDNRPFPSAPVRSKPHRTYDPASIESDYEGDYIPMYLAHLYFRQEKKWEDLRMKIEQFGKSSGMFDEIAIKQLGRGDGDPFQVQIRKFGERAKGPKHNLIDVGYGVSQILPVITDVLRPDGPRMFLMQQPEVHLHPRAQAALGSLLCEVAARGRQLVVETHSDYLLDRIRIDVQRGKTKLKPEDVSILYFERKGLDVTIHSIGIDEQGNIVGAPASYRQFFMEETAEDLGF